MLIDSVCSTEQILKLYETGKKFSNYIAVFQLKANLGKSVKS
jgi:hypothetical protein